MGEAGIEARPIAKVDGEADGAVVVEGVEHSTVSKASGETALLEHLAREGGEDVMECFVEEHCLGGEGCKLTTLFLSQLALRTIFFNNISPVNNTPPQQDGFFNNMDNANQQGKQLL